MRSRGIYRFVVPFAAAFFTFVCIAVSIENGGEFSAVDVSVGEWLRAHEGHALTNIMLVISYVGAPSTLTAIVVVLCVALARSHSYDRLVVVLVLALGGNLLNYGLKNAFHRQRPELADPLLILRSYSFPSGHAMASTVFYGFLISVVLLGRQRWQRAAIAGGVVMIALVDFSRVYLGVHFLSDVLAGSLEAVAWSTLVIAVWHTTRASPATVGPRR